MRPSAVTPQTAQSDPPPVASGYLQPKDAARHLGISIPTLNRMRREGNGPPFRKPTPRLCIYSIADLNAWADRNSFNNTTEARSAGMGAPLAGAVAGKCGSVGVAE
jgi:hypothetical protein